ncbi:MAG: NAD-binding protein [Pedobacter sp.]|nr:NAD-binding protein [Chitinophagaceae bacterium]
MSSKSGHPLKIQPVFVVIVTALVFVFAIVGFKEELGHEFNIFAVIYTTIGMFLMHHVPPNPENIYLMLAKFLATLMLGLGIFSLAWDYFYRGYIVNKIRLRYNKHVVIFSLNIIGRKICFDLLKKGYQVIVVESNKYNPYKSEVEKLGAIVLPDLQTDKKTLEATGLVYAKTCIIAGDEDAANIDLAKRITHFILKHKNRKEDDRLKLAVHIKNTDNVNLLKDYFDIHNQDEHYDLETFNVELLAAKKLYDKYPPHKYLTHGLDEENAIAIIGYNHTAENFLLENIILSHYPDLQNLKVYLIDKDADTKFADFAFKHPYYSDFIDLVPVKLLNETFFANFAWSKKHIEQISQVKIVYFFGEDDAELMNQAANFRQFLYSQTLSISLVPIVICLPENDGVIDLLDTQHSDKENVTVVFKNGLNIHNIKLFSDTCNSNTIEENELTDSLARIINYFYAIKYEFAFILEQHFGIKDSVELIKFLEDEMLTLPGKMGNITEADIDKLINNILVDKLNIPSFKLNKKLTIDKRWNALNHRKKDSNRFAARHISVKIDAMKKMGCWPLTYENIKLYYPKLASIEHKRWCAEKMIFNFKYGAFPDDKNEKYLLKEILKIHDQLIPYDKLTAHEKEKDLNLFLLLVLLQSVKPNHD